MKLLRGQENDPIQSLLCSLATLPSDLEMKGRTQACRRLREPIKFWFSRAANILLSHTPGGFELGILGCVPVSSCAASSFVTFHPVEIQTTQSHSFAFPENTGLPTAIQGFPQKH